MALSMIKRNLLGLNVLGLWPIHWEKYPTLERVHYYYGLVLFCWFTAFTSSQFVEMRYIWGNFEEMTTNAGVSLLYTVGIAKVYIPLFKRDKVLTLVRKIQKTEAKIANGSNENVKRLLENYVDQNWTVTRRFWWLTFFTIMGFFFIPPLEFALLGPQEIVRRGDYTGNVTRQFKRPLVFSSWFPFDKYQSPFYEIAYGLQTISGTIGASFLAVTDTFYVALMIYPCGQLKILQYLMKNLRETMSKGLRVDFEDGGEPQYLNNYVRGEKKIYRNLLENVKHHCDVIE